MELLYTATRGQGTLTGHKVLRKKEKNIRQFSVSQVDLAEEFFWVSAPVSDEVVSADLLLRLLEDGFGVLADLLA